MARVYDVAIIGGGFAGNVQARHLLINIPGIKIALVDRRDPASIPEDRKVGESTVEIASIFLSRELQLYEYLIEHQRPKHGLNFHWPRDPAQTESMQDYFSCWTHTVPPVGSFQLHRGQFEHDLLQMNAKLGVEVIRGTVTEVALRSREPHELGVRLLDNSESREPCRSILLRCRFLIDASGRARVLGRRLNNILHTPEALYHLDTGASWLRVRDINRQYFDVNRGGRETLACKYYGTNHFFGKGHWCWHIPIAADELSVGLVFHRRYFDHGSVDTSEKLIDFLGGHHKVLHRMVSSGVQLDFRTLRHLPYLSRSYISPQRWCVLGDAAAFLDPFYSVSSSTIAFQVDYTTDIIKDLLQGRDVDEKIILYDSFLRRFLDELAYLYRDHERQLGHASAMSWRVFFETIGWFNIALPLYIGGHHRSRNVIRRTDKGWRRLTAAFYDAMNDVVDRELNIGFKNAFRNDGGFFSPTPIWHDYLVRGEFGDHRVNLAFGVMRAHLIGCWYLAQVLRRTQGLAGLARPKHLRVFAGSAATALGAGALALRHAWRWQGRSRTEYHEDHDNTFPRYQPPSVRGQL